MIIVVEGIDRVGKTTLCKKLQESLGFSLYKHHGDFDYSKMDNDNETDKMLQMLEVAKIGNANIIFDRFHWSDFVYGMNERKYDIDNAVLNTKKIDKKLNELNSIIILIKPTDLEESSRQHGKDLKFYEIMFECLCEASKVNAYQCDYNTMDEIVQKIKEKIL